MKPKYKPGDELTYLGQKVQVLTWYVPYKEYKCHCPTWGEDIYCQEKDLKPEIKDG